MFLFIFVQYTQRIQNAVEKVIADAKHLTVDLGGNASTQEMGNAIAEAVQ